MTVYVDADACPITRIAERIAKDHGIPVILLCDTNHQLTSDYSTVKVIGAGADAVDIVPHNAMADSLMEGISLFVEENCEAEILEETREIR
ncbi:MAG: hypothetical protein IKG87_07890 [Clostridia bacterium]|nr:hypothetical protein [Clostridia bacterium]